MGRYRAKGVITVFFSLTSVLILSLICTTLESARVQGARAQAANIADMGNYSVFGEYEKKLPVALLPASDLLAELRQSKDEDEIRSMKAAQRFYEKHGFRRVDAPLGSTGHFGCDVKYLRELGIGS